MLERLIIQGQDRLFSFFVLGFLVKAKVGLTTKHVLFDHFLNELRRCEHLSFFIVRRAFVYITGHMHDGIEANQVCRPKGSTLRVPYYRTSHFVYSFNA